MMLFSSMMIILGIFYTVEAARSDAVHYIKDTTTNRKKEINIDHIYLIGRRMLIGADAAATETI